MKRRELSARRLAANPGIWRNQGSRRGIFSLAFLLLGLGACGKGEDPSSTAAPAALPADVAPLAAALQASSSPEKKAETPSGAIQATGELVSPRRSDLVPRWPGRVEAVLVEEGQVVRRGDPMLRLEADYLRLNVTRSEAELARAKAAAQEAANELARKTELKERGSIPTAAFERAQAVAAETAASLAAAEATVALGHRQLEDAVVESPLDGVVAERRVEVGERVSDGTVTFVVVAVNPLRLRFALPERHLAQVHLGDEVRAEVDAWPGETFVGKVVMIGQVVDPATRTFAVEAELPNPERRLRPGLFARVELRGAAGGA